MVALAALTHLVVSTSTGTLPPVVQQAAHKASSGGGSLLTPFAEPLSWVLAGIYSVVPNYGVAILGLSLLWMLLISPLTLKSTRSMLAMQKLQPELKKLQAKHKDDRQAFAQAQMDLFREHNVSPFGSCLPMLLPLPVFFALFRLIDGLSTTYNYTYKALNGQTLHTAYTTPKFLDQGTKMYKAIVASHGQLEAFGMNLAKSPIAHHSGVLSAAPYWIAILIMAGTSYLQTSMMQTRNQAAYQANPQMRMMKYLAPAFALICIRFPVGVIVYYATSNICRILQQDAMYRYDPKVKNLVDQEVEEVEELTLQIDEREKNRPGYTAPRGAKPATPDKRQAPARPTRTNEPPATGRSRFRDLLQAAADEQEKKRQGKGDGRSPGASGGNGSAAKGDSPTKSDSPPKGVSPPKGGGNGTGSRNNGNGTGTQGNGSAKAGGGAQGGNNRNRPQSSRTNRKRRGR